MSKVVRKDWSMTGMETGRMLKQYLIWKTFQIGWIAEGPGWMKLFELSVRHRIGYWIGYLSLRYERQWSRLRPLPSRIKQRLRGVRS